MLLPYWQPVELSQYWHDVLALASASDKAWQNFGQPEDIQWFNQTVRNTGQQ